MEKYALLVGISEYEHDFENISTACRDVLALQEILKDPLLGQFKADHIKTIINGNKQTIEESIYELFFNKEKDDLVFFYFSGHGIKDFRGAIKLFLAVSNTRRDKSGLVTPTAISATQIHEYMEQSRSSRQVVVLDCCYSGAFPKGLMIKGDELPNQEDLERNLGGKGRAILTASSSVQPAYFGEKQLSEFTHFLVQGIKTGDADLNYDGEISLDEIYSYVSSEMSKTGLNMTPEFYPVKEGYSIILSRSNKSSVHLQLRTDSVDCGEYFTPRDVQKVLSSEIERVRTQTVSYSFLETCLRTERWNEASGETEKIILSPMEMHENSCRDFRHLPCDVVHSVSALWDKYSHGRFGLWAQREIWNSDKVLRDPAKFLDCVGWLDDEYGFLSQGFQYSMSAPKGHLPLLFNSIFDLFERINECESENNN